MVLYLGKVSRQVWKGKYIHLYRHFPLHPSQVVFHTADTHRNSYHNHNSLPKRLTPSIPSIMALKSKFSSIPTCERRMTLWEQDPTINWLLHKEFQFKYSMFQTHPIPPIVFKSKVQTKQKNQVNFYFTLWKVKWKMLWFSYLQLSWDTLHGQMGKSALNLSTLAGRSLSSEWVWTLF